MNPLRKILTPEGQSQDASHTRTVALLVVLMGIAGVVVYAALYRSAPPHWQLVAGGMLAGMLAAAGAVSAVFSQRGQHSRAAWLLIIFLAVFAPFFGAFQSGVGLFVAIIDLFMILVIGYHTLDQSEGWKVTVVGVLAGIASGLLDLFSARFQFDSQRLAWVIWLMAFGAALGFLAYVAYRFRSLLLPNKLVVAFVIVTLVVSGIFSAFIQAQLRSLLTDSVGQEENRLAKYQALAVGDLLDKEMNTLNTLALTDILQSSANTANASYGASDPSAIRDRINQLDQQWIAADQAGNDRDTLVRSRLNNLSSQQLNEYRRKFPHNVEVFVTDRYGALIASTNRTSDYNQADEDWWQTAYQNGQGGTYISEPEYDLSSKSFSLKMAIPVVDSQTNQVIGVLRTTYAISELYDLLNFNASSGGGASLYFLGSGKEPRVLGTSMTLAADKALVSNLESHRNLDYFEGEYLQKMSLVSQAAIGTISKNPTIDSLGWRLVVYQPVNIALASVTNQLRVITLLTMIIVGIVSILTTLLAQYMAGPIARLTKVAEELAAGQLTARVNVESQDEIGSLAATLNTMAEQLSTTLKEMEQRVSDRTRALQTSTEIGRRISTMLDRRALVFEVVEELHRIYHYYHVHLYLFDEGRENLVMAGGSGEVGQELLKRNHSIPKGRGLVGKAAETNSPVLSPNTRANPNWLPNPLLPDTRSEVAVPISIGENVLGVLDVQQDVVNGLTQTDAELLQSVASQVAVALQNARSYAEAQRQADREALIGAITQKIREASTVDEALKVAARELGRAAGAQETRIRLGMETHSGNGHD